MFSGKNVLIQWTIYHLVSILYLQKQNVFENVIILIWQSTKVNQHPLAHHEGWMDGKWLEKKKLLGSSY
jgi:hypothetical protein